MINNESQNKLLQAIIDKLIDLEKRVNMLESKNPILLE